MIALGDIAVMGGGCYGTFYLGQLVVARRKGAIDFHELLMVDRDPACPAAAMVDEPGCRVVVASWSDFLDDFLDRGPAGLTGENMIVPTPLMPHLMAEWLERHARATWPDRDVGLVPAEEPLGTPYDRLHTDRVRYVSFADWLCPTHCVEPLLCPAIAAPRTWEMADAVTEWTSRRATTGKVTAPALFRCQHVAYGVGMYPARTAPDAFAAFRAVADHAPAELVIGSISSCHGALAVLRVGEPRVVGAALR